MSIARGRPGYTEAALKGGDSSAANGFGNEIERMLMDRPMTRQSFTGLVQGPGAAPSTTTGGGAGNTLDELMAELGMLRGERGELSLPDRQLGRTGTRTGPQRVSATGGADLSLLAVAGGAVSSSSNADGPLRPSTPRTSAAAVAASAAAAAAAAATSALILPPAKGALPAHLPTSTTSSSTLAVPGGSLSGSSLVPLQGGVGPIGPGRSQSPMASRRSVPGALNGQTLGAGAATLPVGCSGTPGGPPPGVLERQTQVEGRLEKMELREQQLMALISQLQQQVAALSRAQQATQQQLAVVSAAVPASPPPPPSSPPAPSQPAAPAPAPAADGRQRSPVRTTAPPPPPAADDISDEDFIKNDDGDDDESPAAARSTRHRSIAAVPQPPVQQLQQQQSQRLGTPTPPTLATGGAAGGGGRPTPNKLVPSPGVPPEWEVDVSHLRKELGTLAANVVRLRDQVATLVPGGPSPLAEEVAAQGAAEAQLKQNLTQIAMDVVSLHKGLTSLKQNTERTHAALDKSINDIQLQIQTNALNLFASGGGGPAPATPGRGGGGGGSGGGSPNAVAATLAATGGVSGSLEESLRTVFAQPAVRSLPAFNFAANDNLGFMPDNSGAAAAVSAYGGMAGGAGAGGGGLGAALALLNSFEEQAAAEQAEQQKAAMIARQAVSIVDAKVKQVIIHVDRHMQIISSDLEERLRMYEQTIIRMAQQIDRVQRVLKDIEGTGVSRIVVRQGGKDPDEEVGGGEAETEAAPVVKENWVKMAAMATGRFVPQKPDEKKPVTKAAPHGYFRAPT